MYEDLPLEELFSPKVKLSINNRVLSDEEKQKALEILKLTFGN